MQYPKLTALLVVLAVAVAELAVFPGGVVRHLLHIPAYARMYVAWSRERNEWNDLLARAERHDPQAMFEVAMAMENGFYGSYGLVRVSGQSRDLIRGAAAGGYVPARIRVWQTEGGTARELYEMLLESGDSWWEGAGRSQTTAHWREAALRDCYAPLYSRDRIFDEEYGRHYRVRTEQLDPFIANHGLLDRGPLAVAESLFVQACGFSPWPAGSLAAR